MIGNFNPKNLFSGIKTVQPAFSLCLKKFLVHPLVLGFSLAHKSIYNQVGEWFFYLNLFLLQFINIFPKTHKSHPLSKLLRPCFEYRQVRMVFGASIVALLVVAGITGGSASAAFPSGADADIESDSTEVISVVEAPKNVVVKTERRFQIPVRLIGVSQGFHSYHPGVDLRAEYGSDIRSIAEGVVKDVYRSAYGYGQSVIIDHADGYSSMYAHVQRISVEPGSDIDQETEIAQIGLTGYTTGPHLHLEIYKQGRPVNPKYFLEY